MSRVLSVDDLTAAAWVFRQTADDLDGLAALLDHRVVPTGLSAVVRACREHEGRLQCMVRVSQDSDALLGARFLRAVGALAVVAPLGPNLLGVALLLSMSKGTARVTDEGFDPAPIATTPPRSLAHIASGLALRDRAKHGAIDVRLVQHADNSRTVIVDITGLQTQAPVTRDVASLPTCVRAMSGAPTAYEDGVVQALKDAGVGKSESVMMVGHSLGGMVAVNATNTLCKQGYRVTHVLTLGAPIGRTVGRVPSSVRVLAVEDRSDLVPFLDGRGNPRKANVVTKTFDVPGMHDAGRVYQPGIAELEAKGDTQVREFARSASAFLDGTSVQTHRYTITKSLLF